MIDFKGVSWRSLINQMDMDTVNSMERSDLSKVVTRLAAVANKRLDRMKYKGINNGAKRFSASRDKTVGELKREFSRVVNFLNNDLNSISGLNKLQEEMRNEAKMYDVDLPEYSTAEFANKMSRALATFVHGKELGYWERMQWDSDQARDYARQLAISNPDKSISELNDEVDNMFYDFAKKQAEDFRRNEDVDTSTFFQV